MEANGPRQQGGPDTSRQPRQGGGDRQSGGRASGRAPEAPGKPGDDSRRRKPAGRYTGWNDGIDRVWCVARVHEPASTFPVHSRAAATRPVVTVATREGQVLICDGEHRGDHRWPHLAMEERPEE